MFTNYCARRKDIDQLGVRAFERFLRMGVVRLVGQRPGQQLFGGWQQVCKSYLRAMSNPWPCFGRFPGRCREYKVFSEIIEREEEGPLFSRPQIVLRPGVSICQ